MTVELTTSASVELLKLFYDRFDAWDVEAVLAVMDRDVIACAGTMLQPHQQR